MRKLLIAIIMLFFMFSSCRGQTPDTTGKQYGGMTYRGVNLTSWTTGEFSRKDAELSLDQLSETGVNTVVVVPTWYQKDAGSSEILFHKRKSASEADLRIILSEAKRRGFKIALKPHIDSQDGQWRGSIRPENPDKWFISYGYYLVKMAKLAEEYDCAFLIMGTELKAISGKYPEKWKKLIDEIRLYYKGPLTYASNWDEFEKVCFWNDLDYLGIDAYFPLSDEKNPSLKTLESGWSDYNGTFGKHNWLGDIENWQKKHNKPVIFTEVGYMSWDYSGKQPWVYVGDNPYNGDLQARCYQALINISKEKDWLIGIIWWNWEPKPVKDAKGECSLPPQGKPAEEVLKKWGED